MRLRAHLWPLAAGTALLTACASHQIPPPQSELARADMAVEQAVQGDALRHSPLALQEARRNLDQARLELERNNYLSARRLAEKAEVDAQLALAQSQARQSEALAQETLQGLDTLREEINRQEGVQ